MSFKDTLSSLDQLISRKNDFFYNTLENYQDQLEPFSGHESQDIYCWLGRKLDPAYLAATLACNLTGLAETFYFSLKQEIRNDFDLLSTALKSRFFRRFEMTIRSFRDNKVPVNLWIHI